MKILKKILFGLSLFSIPFLTSGCIIQDKIAEYQQKVEESKMNELEKIIKTANDKEFDTEDIDVESTVYKFLENNYNQISYFKDKNTGADTYAFRVKTDLEIGNSGTDFFNYEIGRIMLNSQDINKSKCSYNYRTKLDNKEEKWIECSDKTFVESIPKIAEMKKQEYEKYKSLIRYIEKEEFCSLGDNSETVKECKNIPEKYLSGQASAYDDAQHQLAKLRNTTL